MFKLLVWGGVATAALYYTKLYFGGNICKCRPSLDEKVVIVTGANSGIGKEVALELARLGATVWLACRDPCEAKRTRKFIIEDTKNSRIVASELDLNSFESIELFAQTFNKSGYELYALVNNAGVFYFPPTLTEDGFDVTFQTNYLGPFLLTHLLLDKLKYAPRPSRIINVSSEAHRYLEKFDVPCAGLADPYDRFRAYAGSKLCLMLFTYKLSQILDRSKVTVLSVDPGNVETGVYRHFPPLSHPVLAALQVPIRYIVVKTPREGAQSVLHALLCPDLKTESGKYIRDCCVQAASPLAVNQCLSDELWQTSLEWCEIQPPYGATVASYERP